MMAEDEPLLGPPSERLGLPQRSRQRLELLFYNACSLTAMAKQLDFPYWYCWLSRVLVVYNSKIKLRKAWSMQNIEGGVYKFILGSLLYCSFKWNFPKGTSPLG